MKFTDQDLARYQEDGFLIKSNVFDGQELEQMCAEMERLAIPEKPGVVLETNGLIRALHGCHQDSPVFERIVREPRLLAPAKQILGDSIYVHQFKINVKAAFGGDVWPWHQDFIFWAKEDGVPSERLFNAAIFLDEVSEFNGPLHFIPGSHRQGMIEVAPAETATGWQANVSASLKYTVPHDRVADLVEQHGCVAPKGEAGSVLFFHPNLVHGSVPNISPKNRRLAIITYNCTDNHPRERANPRPAFLISRDFSPLVSA